MNINLPSVLIGCIAALLPLYIRFSSVNLERVSKSNALFCLIPILVLMFGEKLRSFPRVLGIIFILVISHLILFQFEPASMVGMYRSIGIGLGILFLVKYHESFDDIDTTLILNFLCLGALIQSVLSIFQHYGIDIYEYVILALNPDVKTSFTQDNVNNYVCGSLQNPNILGAYLAMCLPAFFRGNLVYLSIPVVLSIIFAGSLMPLATAFFSIAYFLFAKSKIKEALFYIATTVGFYVYCTIFPIQTSGRLESWREILGKLDFLHFFSGRSPSWLGLQSIFINDGHHSFSVQQEHNEYLAAFNNFGVFGLAAFGYVFYLIISNQNKNKIFASIVFAAFINMHGNFPLHIAATAFIILIAVAHCLKGQYVSNVDR